MNKEEAREKMALLELALERTKKEIKNLQSQFCGSDNHYFFRWWKKTKKDNEYLLMGRICVLCSKKIPLELAEKHEAKRRADIPIGDIVQS